MALKQYPRLNMKRAFWRWYLSQTAVGKQNFQNLSDNLVLYTNVNRTTVLYRLKTATFGKKFFVSPMLKRKIVMMTATLKLFFRKHKKEIFEKIKESSQGMKKTAVQRMLNATKKKQINCLKVWMRNTKTKNRIYAH